MGEGPLPFLILFLKVTVLFGSSEGQLQFRRWQHQGLERLHLLYAPLSAEENTSLPLWLLCPGTNVDALSMVSIADLTSLAEEFSTALVVLQGVDLRLNVGADARAIDGRPDDIGYTKAVIADAGKRIRIDDQQIYCIGSSRGARFCSRLASELHFPALAGLLLNAGLRLPRPNNASMQLPIIAMHDLKDKVNPYDGHGAAYWQESVPEAVQAWADFNQCKSKTPRQSVPTMESLGPMWLERHVDCESFAEVWIMVTDTGRHSWPGKAFVEIGWQFLQLQSARRQGEVPKPAGENWPDEWPLYTEGAATVLSISWPLLLGSTSML
mmetsp:Transcript_70267/g.142293  ORF Transcript_70267/g.142293 Transcript_70267/m.142293 type:complete len:325 (-) Transcript_70267:28-1002(-)